MEVERLLGRALALERQRYAQRVAQSGPIMESCRKGISDRSAPGVEALQVPVSDNSAVTVATSKLLILAQEQLG
jgi:hypothetical protein